MGKTHHNQLFYFYYINLFKSNALQFVSPPQPLEPLFKNIGHFLGEVRV
jgi:hypothetical protein